MKQIAYLSVVFLPPMLMTVNHSLYTSHRNNSFCFKKGVFGMNTKEIVPGSSGSIPLFVALTALLMIVTVWMLVAFRSRYLYGQPFARRLAWPVLWLHEWWYNKQDRYKARRRPIDRTMKDDYEEMKPNDSWL